MQPEKSTREERATFMSHVNLAMVPVVVRDKQGRDLRLRDDSLQYRLAHGITVRMGLEAKPGQYVVRLVVRDSEGSLMSAINGAVDIP